MAARSYVIPAGYNDAIDAAAAQNGLNPDFLRGTIATESSFNPRAISPTGALGLGQVLPSTANDPGYAGTSPIAGGLPLLRSSNSPLFDPVTNINFSAAYLAARGTTGYSGGEYSSVVPIGRDGLPSGAAGSLGASSSSGADPFAGTGSSSSAAAAAPSTGVDGLPYTDPFTGTGSASATLGADSSSAAANPDATITGLIPDPNNPGSFLPSTTPGYSANGNPVNDVRAAITGATTAATGSIHDWFRRIIIAILGLIMLTVAIAALARAGAVGAIRKGVGV